MISPILFELYIIRSLSLCIVGFGLVNGFFCAERASMKQNKRWFLAGLATFFVLLVPFSIIILLFLTKFGHHGLRYK